MEKLICIECQKEFSSQERIWKCPCGGLLDIEFQPAFPIDKIRQRKPNMWRYREAIPISDDGNIITLDEGFTPLIPVEINGISVLIKQDHLFPTGSYKDRGASVLISKVKELGVKNVVEDSSGNAGCAIAAYSDRGEIHCQIFVPEDTSPGKLAQIQLYGAKLNKIPGSREDTARAVLKAAEKDYYASHSWNPFFFQGTKTFAFEICEQLGWKAPDSLIVPVGNGTLLLGAFLGFGELLESGIIEKTPKIIGVQSIRCAPLYKAFQAGLDEIPKIEKGETLAEGIAIAEPVRGKQILDAVIKTHGRLIAVDELEIIKSLRDLGQKGFYVEPTSAATIAGLGQYLKTSDPNEITVSVLTGHGLKATEKILKVLGELPPSIY
ncbi:MAG: pyridoxal-phosphate dependent enzyme [Deltaproteobacteria bacterium]|nr:pyridoxal-phosphate dependent enzyme [Deltaproteobacteria bacterium]